MILHSFFRRSADIRLILGVVGLLASALFATAAAAETYRIVPGDTLSVSLAQQGIPEEMRVDIDGQIRLAEVGGMQIAGLTLDQAEDLIEAEVTNAGLYIDPRVSLAMLDYADVIVAGDVSRPGGFPYLPGMTVATAVALSGGTQVAGVSRFEVDRARADVEGQIRIQNFEIGATVARLARLEAAAAGQREVVISDDLQQAIPSPGELNLAGLIETETQILVNELDRSETLLSFWDQEITSLTSQIAVFEERIRLQDDIVASVQDALETSRELQEKGLQTASRLNTAEQRDFDARSRALELQSAATASAQALADAQRAKAQYIARVTEDRLLAVQENRIKLSDLRLRYSRAQQQLGLLTGGNVGALLVSENTVLNYTVLPAWPREMDGPTSAQTPVRPGDTIVVTIDMVGSVTGN